MDRTQKTILTITSIILSILLLIIFGKLLKFERFKDDRQSVETVDKETINKLYSYLPSSNDYNYDTMYNGGYSTFNSISPIIVERMIVNYIISYEHEKCETFDISEIVGEEENITESVVCKISTNSMVDGLKAIFGENVTYTPRDANLDYQTKAVYKNGYLYVYNTIPESENNYKVYRGIVRYSVDKDKTIKIYDYYLKCDTITGICYNDDRLINNSTIVYNEDLKISEYEKDLKQYEHIFKLENDNYYWANSSMK